MAELILGFFVSLPNFDVLGRVFLIRYRPTPEDWQLEINYRFTMKTDVHPKYFPSAKATCACGAEFTVGSTTEKIDVEICSQCHPLFTGMEKALDTAGRVEKFKARRAAAQPKKAKK